jgi:putative transcriptional regulator
MKTSQYKPSQGKILISEPFLGDFYFRRSVVLLADYSEEGSFGLILNKPLEVKINDVLKDFPAFDTKLFLGGPVQTESLFMLHTLGKKIEASMEVMKGLFWGGNFDQLKEMILENQVSPSEVRFYIGYSGWEPKQLDQELEKHSWVVSTTKLDEVLGKSAGNLWKNTLKKMGSEYAQWINYPTDPILN